MNLPRFAVRNQSLFLAILLIVTIWGSVTFWQIPRREDPGFTIRVSVIATSWPGVPAETIEKLVTQPLEREVAILKGIKVVHSVTTAGLSTVFVEAGDALTVRQVETLWDEVRAHIARVPMPSPQVAPFLNTQFGDTYSLVIAVYDQGSTSGAQSFASSDLDRLSESVADQIRLLDGVEKVERFGVQPETIYLEVDAGEWANSGVTIDELRAAVHRANRIESGGEVRTGTRRTPVAIGRLVSTESKLAETTLPGRMGEGGAPVSLKDVGISVRRSHRDPPEQLARCGNTDFMVPCVTIAVAVRPGFDIISVSQQVKDCVTRLQETRSIPASTGIEYIADQATIIREKIDSCVNNVIGAIALVVVVVFLFVGFRSALVMAANIPIVLLTTLAMATLFGITIEQMSVAAIIIALGLLVDNAVQVCDQARVNIEEGMEPMVAAATGAQQLASAMLNGTMTTVAVFLPMLLTFSQSSREYIFSLPVVLTITLLVSYLLAVTFCVLLAGRFIRRSDGVGSPLLMMLNGLGWLVRVPDLGQRVQHLILATFGLGVRVCIAHPGLTLVGTFLLTVAAFSAPVKSEFFPKDRRDQFAVEVWLPAGTDSQKTLAVTKQVERALQQLSRTTLADGSHVERVRAMRSLIGGGGARWYLSRDPEALKSNYAEILVRTASADFTNQMVTELRTAMQQGKPELGITPIAGARIIPRSLILGPPVPTPVAIRIYGDGLSDQRTLREHAERLKSILAKHPGTWDVHDSWQETAPQLNLTMKEELATLAGVTNEHAVATLRSMFDGNQLTELWENDRRIPVVFRMARDDAPVVDEIENVYVEGSAGKVPFTLVGNTTLEWGESTIQRRDLSRMIEVRARPETGYLANEILADILKSGEMAEFTANLPTGFWTEVAGEAGESSKSEGEMNLALLISMAAIVLLLMIQFNSFALMGMVLVTFPLSLVGAIPGISLMGYPLGFMPSLGVLSLLGIGVNAAIIYLDFVGTMLTEEYQRSGPLSPLRFAQVLERAAKSRLMPIFLTTATTVGGLVPLAVSGGPLWEGLAWLMTFGLISGSTLTLFVIPALYSFSVRWLRFRPVPMEGDLTSVAQSPALVGAEG